MALPPPSFASSLGLIVAASLANVSLHLSLHINEMDVTSFLFGKTQTNVHSTEMENREKKMTADSIFMKIELG